MSDTQLLLVIGGVVCILVAAVLSWPASGWLIAGLVLIVVADS